MTYLEAFACREFGDGAKPDKRVAVIRLRERVTGLSGDACRRSRLSQKPFLASTEGHCIASV